MEEFYQIINTKLDATRAFITTNNCTFRTMLAAISHAEMMHIMALLLERVPRDKQALTEKFTVEETLRWYNNEDLICIIESLVLDNDDEYAPIISTLKCLSIKSMLQHPSACALSRAIIVNNIEGIKDIIAKARVEEKVCALELEEQVAIAIRANKIPILKLFIEEARENYYFTSALKTAFDVAVHYNNYEVTKLLLENSCANNVGSALSTAAILGHITIMDLLLDSGKVRRAEITAAIFDAANRSSGAAIKRLLKEEHIVWPFVEILLKKNNFDVIEHALSTHPRIMMPLLVANERKINNLLCNIDETCGLAPLLINYVPIVSNDTIHKLIRNNKFVTFAIIADKYPASVERYFAEPKYGGTTNDRAEIREAIIYLLRHNKFEHVSLLIKCGLRMKPYLVLLLIRFGCDNILSCALMIDAKIITQCKNVSEFQHAVIVAAERNHTPTLKLLADHGVTFSYYAIQKLIDNKNIEMLKIIFDDDLVVDKNVSSQLIPDIILHGDQNIIRFFCVSTDQNYVQALIDEAIRTVQISALKILLEAHVDIKRIFKRFHAGKNAPSAYNFCWLRVGDAIAPNYYYSRARTITETCGTNDTFADWDDDCTYYGMDPHNSDTFDFEHIELEETGYSIVSVPSKKFTIEEFNQSITEMIVLLVRGGASQEYLPKELCDTNDNITPAQFFCSNKSKAKKN